MDKMREEFEAWTGWRGMCFLQLESVRCVMKNVVIEWQDRLDDLYFIAGETGGDFESCDNEWHIGWLPKIKRAHGNGCSFEIEPIPEQELRELIEYCDAPEDCD